MKIKGIDYEKCTACGECVRDCPPGLYHELKQENKSKKIVFTDEYGICIGCGHCVGVCPHNAICYEPEDGSFTFPNIQDLSGIISYRDMLAFLQGKRSIRQFKSIPLPREEIKAVLSAMQYAPSATNARRWEYCIITNPETRDSLAAEIVKLMKKAKILIKFKWLFLWLLPRHLRTYLSSPGTKIGLQEFLSDYEQGFFSKKIHSVISTLFLLE